ncbi:MAG: peptidoglycan DD-metalloendopeptidase family protein [Candidatus Pacebacteria bacterium]|nr:peptidoglycan DD-metalloendopeptidase family protein [Candidatus Paceibacterota bacterium]NUQ56883.1 peptidoglycan DD-metalloendopeptidase family protein [Candidatus Paceibacter sp.]
MALLLGAVFFLGQVNLAEAGFFYFGSSAEASKLGLASKKETANLQTMPLLESSLSYEVSNHKGGGEIAIVNNNSLLPESGPLGTMADVEELNSDWQINVYVVREGDTLSQIAQMFGVSVNTIIWSNDISRGSSIKPGQTLVILPITGVKYEVKKGDTLKSIAKKLNSDVDEIIKFNGLDADGQLAVGETIIVPNGEMPAPSAPKTTRPGSNPYRGGSGPSYAGYYMKPIAGGVKSQGLHGYNGVDLANSCGTPVLASASGDVIISKAAGWNGGYGNYIVVSHSNGTQTLYSHLSTNIVYPGWRVSQGQVIGYVGSTGKSTGCHLHFEVRGAKNPF